MVDILNASEGVRVNIIDETAMQDKRANTPDTLKRELLDGRDHVGDVMNIDEINVSDVSEEVLAECQTLQVANVYEWCPIHAVEGVGSYCHVDLCNHARVYSLLKVCTARLVQYCSMYYKCLKEQKLLARRLTLGGLRLTIFLAQQWLLSAIWL